MKASEIRLIYTNKIKAADRSKINASQDAYEIFVSHWDMDIIQLQEQFKCLLLNRSNEVLGIYHHSIGATTGVVVDVRLLLAAAIKANAISLIVAHNHPSGNLSPSSTDLNLTRKLKDACKLLEFTLLDHLIITNEGYHSCADHDSSLFT
jgi:DNA repair protein RadC